MPNTFWIQIHVYDLHHSNDVRSILYNTALDLSVPLIRWDQTFI